VAFIEGEDVSSLSFASKNHDGRVGQTDPKIGVLSDDFGCRRDIEFAEMGKLVGASAYLVQQSDFARHTCRPGDQIIEFGENEG